MSDATESGKGGGKILVVQHYMNWNEKSGGAMLLKKICGVLVLFGGLYMIYTAP